MKIVTTLSQQKLECVHITFSPQGFPSSRRVSSERSTDEWARILLQPSALHLLTTEVLQSYFHEPGQQERKLFIQCQSYVSGETGFSRLHVRLQKRRE